MSTADAERAKSLCDHAEALSAKGRHPLAIEALEHAIRLQPRHARMRVALGAVRLLAGDAKGAAADFKAAAKIDPRDADAWTRLGGVLALLDDEAGAAEALAKAMDGASDDPETWTHLAQAWADLGHDDEVGRTFELALAAFPAEARVHYALGTWLGQQDDAKGAAEHLAEAVRLDPADAASWTNLATALLMLARADDAADAARRATRLAPADPDALRVLREATEAADRARATPGPKRRNPPRPPGKGGGGRRRRD